MKRSTKQKSATSEGLPESAAALLARAIQFHRQGRLDQAIDLYEILLRRDPTVPEIHNNLGSALRSAGQLGTAARHFRRAVTLRPKDFVGHANLGSVLEDDARVVEPNRGLFKTLQSYSARLNEGECVHDTVVHPPEAPQQLLLRGMSANPNKLWKAVLDQSLYRSGSRVTVLAMGREGGPPEVEPTKSGGKRTIGCGFPVSPRELPRRICEM